jgi:hypothetical protein
VFTSKKVKVKTTGLPPDREQEMAKELFEQHANPISVTDIEVKYLRCEMRRLNTAADHVVIALYCIAAMMVVGVIVYALVNIGNTP